MWRSTSDVPDGLTWAPSKDGASFTLSGKLGALPTGQTVPVSVSAQSDPSKVVSRIQTAQGALPVTHPPAGPTDYASIGWIAGAILFCGGAMAMDAKIKWGQIDREFVESYIKQMRRLMLGERADFEVIFDTRAVHLAEDLKRALLELPYENMDPALAAIRISEAEFNQWADSYEALRDRHYEAVTAQDHDLAEQLRLFMEVSNDNMERLAAELGDLRHAAAVETHVLDHA
ncbi:MAG: hypothetical protein EOP20_13145 [Hyphomicrobiales bacterium]|nr:MAG: hypothetical protein EOP20_13145 [Hyphomicrobiales bacterium]